MVPRRPESLFFETDLKTVRYEKYERFRCRDSYGLVGSIRGSVVFLELSVPIIPPPSEGLFIGGCGKKHYHFWLLNFGRPNLRHRHYMGRFPEDKLEGTTTALLIG